MKVHHSLGEIKTYRGFSQDHPSASSLEKKEKYSENSYENQRTEISSHKYRNTTFGSTERLPLPKIERKQDFYLPRSKMSEKLGVIMKSARPTNLNPAGKDSPSPSKYQAK
mgnify:CR=1 FL=1